jgi:pyruvate dehydrogenase E2 component (dihydrolipoamide acetyltransferase)
MIEFKMPSLGADMEDGTLVEWRVKPGDKVKRGDIIAEVDTQKGLIEVEVFDEGTIAELLVEVNEKVPVGTTMARIQIEKEPRPVEPAGSAPILAAVPEESISPVLEIARVRISPLARRIAAENNVDYTSISGSGIHGEILKEDIEKYMANRGKPPGVRKAASSLPAASASENIRKAVAAAMAKSNREIPHYYLEMHIDMSKSLKMLSELNTKRSLRERILPVTLLIKAVAVALRDVPQFNAVWEDTLVMKEQINIALAVSLKNGGVLLPAIHTADQKDLGQIMRDLSEILPRAKELRLRSGDLSDSTIAITSIGDFGAEKVAGVIFPPHVAIVGFGAIKEQPWAENGMLGVRRAIHITLAADHRATDGYTGNRFLLALEKALLNPDSLGIPKS